MNDEREIREILIANALDSKDNIQPKLSIGYLPEKPTIKDLAKFSRIRLRKRRMKKKFAKNPERYVRKEIWIEFLAKVFVAPIMNPLNYQEIGRKLLMVDELPQGAYARYEKAVAEQFENRLSSTKKIITIDEREDGHNETDSKNNA